MRICFSTLACPNWTLPQVIEIAVASGYQGVELRFLEGEDSLWKLSAFQGAALPAAKRSLVDRGIAITCVGTSCRFHSPDAAERQGWVEEGKRMAELAASLGARGIRVFGDKIQPGAGRDSTRGWIAEGVRNLADIIRSTGVEVWLETHGDFASSDETMMILDQSGSPAVGVVWDPANALVDGHERPSSGVRAFGSALRHVHLKDMAHREDQWNPVLTGEGEFPLREIVTDLENLKYDGFISFEWEKKWHPELAAPEIAIPQFAEWFRKS
jgi:sugar phosphate isomerase/epimerase